MNARTLSWVAESLEQTGGLRRADLFGQEGEGWLGATIDSRGECSRRLFFALQGDNTDGHAYVDDARSKGICAAIVAREEVADSLRQAESPVFLVRDVLASLQELSRLYRRELDVRVIAVTGSTGKTTTKEYIRLILRRKYRVFSNPGNLNNHIGVPLTVLGTDHESEYLVSEIGANHLGEVGFLAGILMPDIGVITNIGDAHIGLFGSRRKIAEAKSEMLDCIESEACAVLPRDDDFFDLLREKARCRVVTFGFDESSDFRTSAIEDDGAQIRFRVNQQTLAIRSIGVYNVANAAAAFAVADVCGVETESVREALAEAEPIAGRARVHKLQDITLIDDSYNASPTSMRASIASLGRVEAGRRIAVLGDMAELGSYSDNKHRELGEFISRSKIDRLYWVGPSGRQVREGMGGTKKLVDVFDDLGGVLAVIAADLQPGDIVLVKGSRAASLDKVVEHLIKTLGKAAGEN